MVVTLVVMITAGSVRADSSEEHYERGKERYAAKDYAGAIAEFQAARAIEAQPRYVFNLAQAQRMAGQCADAIASYGEFLATGPIEAQAKVARAGLDKCKVALATVREPLQREPQPQPQPQLHAPTQKEQPVKSAELVMERPRWYRDRVGDGLVVGGGALGITSVTLYVLARRAASATFDAKGTVDDYERERRRASTLQTWSAIMAGASVLLVGGGVLRYVTLQPVPRGDGMSVAVGGRL